MFEQLNLILFSAMNAHAGLAGWQLGGAIFAAEWLILLVPAFLVWLWVRGDAHQREAAVRAFLAAGCALTLNMLIGLLWYNPRPFVAEVGHTFLYHDPDSSFPSDHATSMFSVALVLAFSQVRAARRLGLLLLPLAPVVAWSRVYIGVHWPLDMIGALAVSAGMALLFQTRIAALACGIVVPLMERIYRRVLARPIARGWFRP